MDVIQVESMVSRKDRKPYVILRWEEKSWQLPVNDARQHALAILAAAEGAESDAFIADFVGKNGANDETAIRMLLAFREYRVQAQKSEP